MNNLKSGKSFGKFLLLWSGELISAIGSGLTSFGLAVYVYDLTGRASAMALVTLLAFMPSLLFSAAAGVLADRYDRRLLMVLGDSLSAVGLVFILICMLRGEAQLWQICVGVTVSSVFSSLLEPAYKATITDLLTEELYTKASGLVQAAGSAKYLISPVIAGFLLTVSDIKLLLAIDICTFFVTVAATLVVRSGLASKKYEQAKSFLREFQDGWGAVSGNGGVLVLVVMSSADAACFFGQLRIGNGGNDRRLGNACDKCDPGDPSDKEGLCEDAFGFAVLCRNIHGAIRIARKYCTDQRFGISVFCNASVCKHKPGFSYLYQH